MPVPTTPLDEREEILLSAQKLYQAAQRLSMRIDGVQPEQPKHKPETTLKPYKLVH